MHACTAKDPKVSFLVLAYNQERFIEDAVRSALEIEYLNIEFIISDDSSTDSTYSIIERVASEYAGEKKIRIIRNEKNLGIAYHINNLLKIASGELIFFAAGDDISYKNRVRVVVDAWIKNGRNSDAICSSANLIDEKGVAVGVIKSSEATKCLSDELRYFFGGFIGCTEVITSRMLSLFGEFNEKAVGDNKVFSEDRIFAFRAFLMGGLLCIDDCLVGYRVSTSSVSSNQSLIKLVAYEDARSYRRVELERLDRVLSQCAIDVGNYCKTLPVGDGRSRELLKLIDDRRIILYWQYKATEDSVVTRLFALCVIAIKFRYGLKKFLKMLLSALIPTRFFLRFP